MRTLLAIVIFAGGIFSLNSAADAARKFKRSAKPPHYAEQRRYPKKEESACEMRARHEDPTGQYAGYPCWAREAFARGSRIDNR